MNACDTPKKAPRPYSKHGLTTLKAAVKGLGGRVIDMRTTMGKALAQWRGDLIADMGGPSVVTTQQRALIDLAVGTKLLLDSIDAWLLTQPSLVNARRRSVLPAVLQRQQLADSLAGYMGKLGLERRTAKVNDLKGYLEKQYGKGKNGSDGGPKALELVTNRSDSDNPCGATTEPSGATTEPRES